MHMEESKVDLWEVLKMMPDSMKTNPLGPGIGLDLTPSQLADLQAQQRLEMPQGWRWQVEESADQEDRLHIAQNGSDDVLSYTFLHLRDEKGASYIFILQNLGDHCCNFFRWAMYELKAGKLIDKTEACLPQLGWEDFFSEEVCKAPMPAPLKGDRYPFLIELEMYPPSITISIVADYFDLSFDADIADKLLDNLPSEDKVLFWKRGKFD